MEQVTWEKFKGRLQWRQGQHLSIIGPTNSGKTTLLIELLHARDYVVFCATKPEDPVIASELRKQKFRKIHSWKNRKENEARLLLWPKYTSIYSKDKQIKEFQYAFDEIFAAGCWTVVIDETWYFTNILKLGRYLENFWCQGRSLDITMVCGTQRPKYVPTMMYDQSTHLFFFRFRDENDLERIGGISWISSKEIRKCVSMLEPHEFLYIDSATGEMMISKVNK